MGIVYVFSALSQWLECFPVFTLCPSLGTCLHLFPSQSRSTGTSSSVMKPLLWGANTERDWVEGWFVRTPGHTHGLEEMKKVCENCAWGALGRRGLDWAKRRGQQRHSNRKGVLWLAQGYPWEAIWEATFQKQLSCGESGKNHRRACAESQLQKDVWCWGAGWLSSLRHRKLKCSSPVPHASTSYGITVTP